MQLIMFCILLYGIYSILQRRGTGAALSLFFLVSINDFVLVQTPEDGLLAFADKLWKEFYFFALLIALGINSSKRVRRRYLVRQNSFFIKSFVFLLVICSFYGLVVGAVSGIYDSIVAWRRYFLPILIPFLMYINELFKSVDFRKLFLGVNLLGATMALYAVWSAIVFNGDYTSVWYYDFIANAKEAAGDAERLVQYQIVRDDALRASGFFVSPIEFSIYVALLSSFSILSFVMLKGVSDKIVCLLLTCAYLSALYASNVRAGVLVMGLTLFSSYFIVMRRGGVKSLLVLPVLLIVATFGSFFFSVGLDESALGRLVQYANLVNEFKVGGYGLIAADVGSLTYRDSWYLSVLGVYGVMAPFYFFLAFLPFVKSVSISFVYGNVVGRFAKAAYVAGVGFGFSLVYLFAFHHSVGASYVYLAYVMAFMSITGADLTKVSAKAGRRMDF